MFILSENSSLNKAKVFSKNSKILLFQFYNNTLKVHILFVQEALETRYVSLRKKIPILSAFNCNKFVIS